MADFLPRPDGDFGAWAQHFFDQLKLWWAGEGLKLTDLDPLQQALAAWETRYPQHVAAQAAAEAARQAKDGARLALVAAVRPLARFVQAYPTMTNADRVNMGLPARDGAQGQGSGFEAGGSNGGPVSDRSSRGSGRALRPTDPPRTRPLARVDTSQRLLHTVRFQDEASPTRRRKPAGVLGAEVWLALAAPHEPPPPLTFAGDNPAGAFRFLSVNGRGTLQLDFPSADAGRTAWYALRWINTRGEPGPWSDLAGATVGA